MLISADKKGNMSSKFSVQFIHRSLVSKTNER